jgi:hypothetical protein
MTQRDDALGHVCAICRSHVGPSRVVLGHVPLGSVLACAHFCALVGFSGALFTAPSWRPHLVTIFW